MTGARAGRLERGFTLVELVVSLAVLGVALLLANGLLLEAVRVYAATGRELREPASELALRLLREDLKTSSPLPFGSGSPGPLPCRRDDGTEVWELVDGRLRRHGYGPLGEDRGARPMLDQVEAFFWSVPRTGLVEVTIVRRVPTGTSALRAPTSTWTATSETLEAATVVVASRLEAP